MCCHQTKVVEGAVGSHESSRIVAAGSGFKCLAQIDELLALDVAGAPCSGTRHQALDFPAHFQQPKLCTHVDFGHDDAAPRKDIDQALPCEAVQRFPDRRTSNA